MRRMAMASHMAEMHADSTGWRLPQLDRIAFRIVDAGEAADALHLLHLRHLDGGGAKLVEQLVEAIDAKVEHILAVGGEIVGVGLERREDGGASLLLPHAV